MGNKLSKSVEPIVISLEGNIGAGKSLFFDKLKKHYENDSTICFLEEPIEFDLISNIFFLQNHYIIYWITLYNT